MMAGRDGEAVAGGPARHVPVLVRPAVDWLRAREGGVIIDGTFGGGGYSREILARGAKVIALDRDRDAVAQGAGLVEEAQGRLILAEERFSALDQAAQQFGHAAVDGVVLDLGVSSMQLDQASRGFSFRHDGPLDMRMSGEGPRAADVVAQATELDLADIIFRLGEERQARAVARAIVAARKEAPIRSTQALAAIVQRVVRTRSGAGIHPATRTFQALRIFVNEELSELAAGLAAAERVLKPAGRLVVVTFHSLEDRILKNFLAERSGAAAVSRHRPPTPPEPPTFRVLTRRPVVPDSSELAANPRARSAKLRAGERLDAAPRPLDVAGLLPPLPSLVDVTRDA
jgi:16S rRNA (cytosine1402-N4)-methyltransferase